MSKGAKTRGLVRGFTLLEMMLVLVIIGLLTTVAVWNIAGRAMRRISTTKASLSTIRQALTAYSLDTAQYPASLVMLTQGATPYVQKIPQDGWKREFVYTVPGSSGKPFNLYSLGKDGEAGTQDDLDVWTMDDPRPGQ